MSNDTKNNEGLATQALSAPTGSEWREMGSEPKDGSHFLAYVSEYEIHSASWYCGKLCGTPGPYGYPSGIGRNRVKYWMPIPAIPANAEATNTAPRKS